MRALNVLLSLLVSLLIAAGVLELGLRLIGMGPAHTINRFDPVLGWSLQPGAVQKRSTAEFDVTFEVNELGLRDDPMSSPAKPPGYFRVLMLGDSFVQGYTVQREDLFVDQLERLWKAEGRLVDVINAGTEGWSTDQEVRWLESKGRAFQPDLVLLFAYENDLWWNGRRSYLRFPKPRYQPDGQLERRELPDPGKRPWTDEWALTGLFGRSRGELPPTWRDPESGKLLPAEWGAYFDPAPAELSELWQESYARSRGALLALERVRRELGTEVLVVPIPNKAAILPAAGETLAKAIGGERERWSADRPVDWVLATCAELGLATLDPRPALRAAAAAGESLYYTRDWHFDPSGNRVLASLLHRELDARRLFPPTHRALREAGPEVLATAAKAGGPPTWLKVFLALWAALSLLFVATYRDEKLWIAPLKVGGLLAVIFALVLGGQALLGLLPPAAGRALGIVFVLAILGFVAYKLGRRLGTIAELFLCFVRRGHWYLMPLVVVLLTIGSLLVVAASSPLVAPFIYTLF